nr:cyclic nucleotide-binding domain-containing protein [Brevibacillus massiliensis]
MIQSPELVRDGLYFVKEGALRFYIVNSWGKQFTVGILGKGSTFGEIDSFSLGTHGVYIETIEDTLLCATAYRNPPLHVALATNIKGCRLTRQPADGSTLI